MAPRTLLRTLVRPFARRVYHASGLARRAEEGLLVLDLSVCVPNFLFQRVLGVNRRCRWPVHFTSQVVAPERITLGRRSARSFAVSGGCYIQALNGIEIGDDVLFAPGVKIISANHRPGDLDHHDPAPPVRIGDRCWIGANAVILPGVTLGRGVVVGAGAVVTRSFPDGVVIAGVPARTVRHLEDVPGKEPENSAPAPAAAELTR